MAMMNSDTVMRNSRKDKISFNPRWLHRDSMVLYDAPRECSMLRESVKKEIVNINDPFVSQCTVCLVDNPQDTAGNGPT